MNARLERARSICLGLPGASERLSWGAPTFFAQGRMFAQLWDDYHGDGRLALWCAALPFDRDAFVEAEPDAFFRPPFLGHRGWLGVWLDRRVRWARVTHILRTAHSIVSTR
jgi:hypothetical protein